MFSTVHLDLARVVLEKARAKKLRIVTAESCTGGLVAACLTEIAGSSDVVEHGFVVYSDAAKTAFLGVPAQLISAHGAVSREVARAMAQGALGGSRQRISIAVTGIAGPSGGSAAKPVGLVHFAMAGEGLLVDEERRFGDIGRDGVRLKSVETALDLLRRAL
jgi:nicotinamide-nucleotide amidase